MDTGAEFSPCRKYRYKLWRIWSPDRYDKDRYIAFLMLNPSTADETKNDPTVERCQRRAVAMGYQGMYVINIFALRSTDPEALYIAEDPVGPRNDAAIFEVADECDTIVCAWGTHGSLHNRGRHVLNAVAKMHPFKLFHLGLSKAGHPKHPLYISYKTKPQSYWPPQVLDKTAT